MAGREECGAGREACGAYKLYKSHATNFTSISKLQKFNYISKKLRLTSQMRAGVDLSIVFYRDSTGIEESDYLLE